MGQVIEIKKEKKVYTTTIVVQTSYDPAEIGPTSLLMDAAQGGGQIISKTTVIEEESQKIQNQPIYKK